MKTLNDIVIETEERIENDLDSIDREVRQLINYKYQIKREAIKWVKHWIKLLPKDSYENLKIDLNKIGKPSDYMKIGQIKGFLDFFNIIKSDLE